MKKIIIALVFSVILSSCEKKITYDPAEITPFVGIDAPETGKGHQIHVAPFPVPANFEREWYMRLPIGNKEKIYVTGFEAKMRPGTHHLIAYPFANENSTDNPPIGVLRDQNLFSGFLNIWSQIGTGMNGFILETTAPEYSIELPAGYALPFEAGATLDFNSHYFNKTPKTLFGEVYFNVYTKPKSEVKGILDASIHDNREKLDLPPNAVTVVVDSFIYSEPTELVMLTSHTHKRGQKFEIYKVGGADNGSLIYTSTDYVHPPIMYFNTPKKFGAGEGFRYVVTYNNNTNKTIKFGVTSEDEMGFIYGYVLKN